MAGPAVTHRSLALNEPIEEDAEEAILRKSYCGLIGLAATAQIVAPDQVALLCVEDIKSLIGWRFNCRLRCGKVELLTMGDSRREVMDFLLPIDKETQFHPHLGNAARERAKSTRIDIDFWSLPAKLSSGRTDDTPESISEFDGTLHVNSAPETNCGLTMAVAVITRGAELTYCRRRVYSSLRDRTSFWRPLSLPSSDNGQYRSIHPPGYTRAAFNPTSSAIITSPPSPPAILDRTYSRDRNAY
ncbi:uncharacterized protein CLUP02_05483 [Colletotrichum lupini]|uniref:Uncharacterized protein n=1 Tax=Colletotrichum lupini TaxID=145971 RepID=A0A9Q8WEN6_9PEZI|nr:uncharacterized protein CLUP02_05483 [Colletotrichum lupini]UQC80002.1 hypothetical protein CLUP02_05483 [Colletotrichum lupini]